MRYPSTIVIGLAAALLAGGPALSQGQHMHGQYDKSGRHDTSSQHKQGMMPMGMPRGKMGARSGMMAMHHGMMNMMDGPAMQGAMMRGRHMPMGGVFHDHLDADGDGRVTPAEARDRLGEFLDQYDENDDGKLGIDEFEVLHSRLIRETMVDRFQHLDADGDGRVTREEMTAPAETLERMHKMLQMHRMRGMEDDMMPDSE